MHDLKCALAGVSAIPVTPFAPDGASDLTVYEQLVDRVVSAGVSVVTANGNTGEFYSLTDDERRAAIEAAVAGAAGRALAITGVGLDVETAIALGRFAERAGARALMVHQPVHPFQSADGWVAYHSAIATALPAMGVIPYIRDPNVTPEMVARLAEQENVVGLKYAAPNPLRFAIMAAAVGQQRLAWICGAAEAWAPFFWPGGAVGFTSGLVNIDPAASLDMLRSLNDGDYAGAMAVWQQIEPFEELRARHNSAHNVSVVKEALAQMGVCRRAVRPPISELPEAERAEVTRWLETMQIPHASAMTLA
jgi:4-hydroxy-tetrahydrodipicolinate synthase